MPDFAEETSNLETPIIPEKLPSLPQKTSTKSAVSNQRTKKGATWQDRQPLTITSLLGATQYKWHYCCLAAKSCPNTRQTQRSNSSPTPSSRGWTGSLDPTTSAGCNKGLNCSPSCGVRKEAGTLTPMGLLNVLLSPWCPWRLPPSPDGNERLLSSGADSVWV